MPKSVVRLSAGREDMSEETQALCFLAGANSIFYGPKLLTTPNPGRDRDMALLDKLGLRPMERVAGGRFRSSSSSAAASGAALRHGVNLISARLFGTAFPWHTLIENVTGSLVMGLLVGYFAFKGGEASQHWRLFLTTGILGGYTTFSAFSLDTVLLYERGETALAALYVLASVALAIGGLFAGLALVRHFS